MLTCDRCNTRTSDVYRVVFDDGEKEFILCEKHSLPILKLKDAPYGIFRKKRGRKPFKKVELPV